MGLGVTSALSSGLGVSPYIDSAFLWHHVHMAGIIQSLARSYCGQGVIVSLPQ